MFVEYDETQRSWTRNAHLAQQALPDPAAFRFPERLIVVPSAAVGGRRRPSKRTFMIRRIGVLVLLVGLLAGVVTVVSTLFRTDADNTADSTSDSITETISDSISDSITDSISDIRTDADNTADSTSDSITDSITDSISDIDIDTDTNIDTNGAAISDGAALDTAPPLLSRPRRRPLPLRPTCRRRRIRPTLCCSVTVRLAGSHRFSNRRSKRRDWSR